MNSVVEETAARTVHLRRVFNASVEHLFECFTDPALVAGWWGPSGTTCPGAEVELVVGGGYRFQILGSDSGNLMVVAGEYVEIQQPLRLVFTWQWEGEAEEVSLVTLNFHALADTDQRTELELIHQRFASAERAMRHDAGWSSSFDCLAEFVG